MVQIRQQEKAELSTGAFFYPTRPGWFTPTQSNKMQKIEFNKLKKCPLANCLDCFVITKNFTVQSSCKWFNELWPTDNNSCSAEFIQTDRQNEAQVYSYSRYTPLLIPCIDHQNLATSHITNTGILIFTCLIEFDLSGSSAMLYLCSIYAATVSTGVLKGPKPQYLYMP